MNGPSNRRSDRHARLIGQNAKKGRRELAPLVAGPVLVVAGPFPAAAALLLSTVPLVAAIIAGRGSGLAVIRTVRGRLRLPWLALDSRRILAATGLTGARIRLPLGRPRRRRTCLAFTR